MAKNVDKMCDQVWDVFAARAQGWQEDWENVQAIVEVATKCGALYHVGQIAIGRSHEPNVHMVSASAAQPLELLFLQHTEKFALQAQRNIADLIQEECALVGQFETTDLLRDRACKSALFMPEKFA